MKRKKKSMEFKNYVSSSGERRLSVFPKEFRILRLFLHQGRIAVLGVLEHNREDLMDLDSEDYRSGSLKLAGRLVLEGSQSILEQARAFRLFPRRQLSKDCSRKLRRPRGVWFFVPSFFRLFIFRYFMRNQSADR